MDITKEIIINYIDGSLKNSSKTEFDLLIKENETNVILGRILTACQGYYPKYKDLKECTIPFEKIDSIIIESISNRISNENLNLIINAFNYEYDFVNKILTRIRLNIESLTESNKESLEGLDIMPDNILLEKLGIETTVYKNKEIKIKGFFEYLNDFLQYIQPLFTYPKPVYYLATILIIILIIPTYNYFNHDLIDDYALEKWQRYEIATSTFRSTTSGSESDIEFKRIEYQYKLALSAYTTANYDTALQIINNISTIHDKLSFDINFLAAMSNLSLALSEERIFNQDDLRKFYIKKSVEYFNLAKQFVATKKYKQQNAFYYYFGLSLVFVDNRIEAMNNLQLIKKGSYSEKAKILVDQLKE